MKKFVFTMLCLTTLVVFDACSKNEILPAQENAVENDSNIAYKYNTLPGIDSDIINSYIKSSSNVLAKSSSKTSQSTAMVFNETFTAQADGYSSIKTNKSGVTFNYMAYNTPNLDPSGHAVTLWAVFFDLGVELGPDNISSMYRINGHVIGDDGVIEFGGRINEGQEKDLWLGVPLKDAENFVLLVIAKTHGPAIPGLLHEQLSELDGGCDGDGPDPTPPCYEFLWSLHL